MHSRQYHTTLHCNSYTPFSAAASTEWDQPQYQQQPDYPQPEYQPQQPLPPATPQQQQYQQTYSHAPMQNSGAMVAQSVNYHGGTTYQNTYQQPHVTNSYYAYQYSQPGVQEAYSMDIHNQTVTQSGPAITHQGQIVVGDLNQGLSAPPAPAHWY